MIVPVNVKGVYYKNMYISLSPEKESFLLLRSGIIMSVKEVIENTARITFSGPVFQHVEDIFECPVPSSNLNMYRIKKLGSFKFTASLDEIVTKCIGFPIANSDYCGAIGLLHSNY